MQEWSCDCGASAHTLRASAAPRHLCGDVDDAPLQLVTGELESVPAPTEDDDTP